MIAYVKDYLTFRTIDVLEFESYSINQAYDFSGISIFQVNKKTTAKEHDWIICYRVENGTVFFSGIFNKMSVDSDGKYSIEILQPESLFDRNLFYPSSFYENNPIPAETEIAYFINREWGSNQTDSQMRLPYLTATALTSTTLVNKITATNGMINLQDAILQAYAEQNIIPVFNFGANSLGINVKKDSSILQINATDPDVISYEESKTENALVKLNVQWKLQNEYDFTGAYGRTTFYLTNTGTITTNASASNRVLNGRVDTRLITASSFSELTSKAEKIFADNSFQHKITLNILLNNFYSQSDFYAGKSVRLYLNGSTYETYISSMERSSESNVITVVLGDLATTLTDKLRA